MKEIAANNSMSNQDKNYLTSIEAYLTQIKQIRINLKLSMVKISRLKNSSRKRLAEIDVIINAC